MRLARRLLALTVFTLLALAGPVRAQYMWLDSNGDGINDAADCLSDVGVPTTVDVYIDTAHNKDGSASTCDTGDGGMYIWNYNFCAKLANGTAAFGGFLNFLKTAAINHGADSSSIAYAHGWGGSTFNPPGTYHLARFTVTLLSNTAPGAVLDIVGDNGPSTLGCYPTMFGTQCSGLDFDQSYKLGPNSYGSTDWTDTAGLRSPNSVTAVPVGAVPAGKLVISAAPNPLNPSTELKFTTRRSGRVTMRIFDLSGQLVKVLADESMPAGPHMLRWDGSDATGGRVSSGVYFARLSTPEGEARRIVTVLK